MAIVENILLGYGTFIVDDVPVARTRDGGSFLVERETRPIEADGDRGPVKGRIEIDSEIATLTMNELTFFNVDLIKSRFPGLQVIENVASSTLEIIDDDYHDVKWVGNTKAGDEITITVKNAINMENFEITMIDKNEVVPEIVFTGTYAEDARDESTWSIEYGASETHTVTFTISDSGGVVEGAEVTFSNEIKTTNASGVAVFADVPEGTNKQFKVVKGGYTTYFGAVDVAADVSEAVTIVAI